YQYKRDRPTTHPPIPTGTAVRFGMNLSTAQQPIPIITGVKKRTYGSNASPTAASNCLKPCGNDTTSKIPITVTGTPPSINERPERPRLNKFLSIGHYCFRF